MWIYGKEIRENIKQRLQAGFARKDVALAVLQFGEQAASAAYVRGLTNFARDVGVDFRHLTFPAAISEAESITEIDRLNRDAKVRGIMLQTPFPDHFDRERVINALDPNKDVEGIHSFNMGKLILAPDRAIVRPCTPSAVITMLKANGVELKGARVTVAGSSPIVGKPLALLLNAEKATVTMCNSKTRDLGAETLRAEIVVAAIGKPGIIKPEMIAEGAVVIDVGTNFDAEGRMHGDVDPQAEAKARLISAVPGGVGMITVAELYDNLDRMTD